MTRWIKLTSRITGSPIFFNIQNVAAVQELSKYNDETITRITTIEEPDPWEVLESAETVMRMIEEAQAEPLNETRRLIRA